MSDVIFTRVLNKVTGKYDLRVDKVSDETLIACTFIDEAFNNPTTDYYGGCNFDHQQFYIIINARNRQLKYQLTRPHDEYSWHATKILDSDPT